METTIFADIYLYKIDAIFAILLQRLIMAKNRSVGYVKQREQDTSDGDCR